VEETEWVGPAERRGRLYRRDRVGGFRWRRLSWSFRWPSARS